MKTMKLQIRTCQRSVVLLIKSLQTECCSVIDIEFSHFLYMLNTIYGQKKQGKIQPSVSYPDFLEAPSPGRS